MTQNFFQRQLLHDLTMNYLKMKFLVYLMIQLKLFNCNSEKGSVLWRQEIVKTVTEPIHGKQLSKYATFILICDNSLELFIPV